MEILEKLGLKKSKEIKEQNKKKSLEQWKEKVMKQKINRVGSNEEISPTLDYITQYCFKCSKFNPVRCFSEEGSINTDVIIRCIKIRFYLESKENITEHEQIFIEQFEKI